MSHTRVSRDKSTHTQPRGHEASRPSGDLLIAKPGDRSELEAESAADQMMGGRNAARPWSINRVSVGPEERGTAGAVLRRSAISAATPSTVPPVVREVLRTPGEPLDAGNRGFFEPLFGRDLGSVRLHSDAKAADSSAAVNALAYTVGQDIVLGPERRDLHAGETKKVLAHELAHTVQQSRGGATPTLDPHSPLEREAASVGTAAAAGSPVAIAGSSAPGLARAPKPTPTPPPSPPQPPRPGRIISEVRAPDGTVIDMEVGPAVQRLGLENTLPSGTEVNLQGWQRAHQIGPGLGAESEAGILYAPPEVNLQYQNSGIESFIRQFNASKAADVRLQLRTVTEAHPNSLRLKSITYRLSAVRGQGRPQALFEQSIEIANSTNNPRVTLDEPTILGDWKEFLAPGSSPQPAASAPSPGTPGTPPAGPKGKAPSKSPASKAPKSAQPKVSAEPTGTPEGPVGGLSPAPKAPPSGPPENPVVEAPPAKPAKAASANEASLEKAPASTQQPAPKSGPSADETAGEAPSAVKPSSAPKPKPAVEKPSLSAEATPKVATSTKPPAEVATEIHPPASSAKPSAPADVEASPSVSAPKIEPKVPLGEGAIESGLKGMPEEIPGTGGLGAAGEVAVGEAAGGITAAEVAGIVLATVAELIIAFAIGLFIDWLLGIIEQAIIERDIEALNPQIRARIAQQADKITTLQKQNSKVYARISIDVMREEGYDSPEGYFVSWNNYVGTRLAGVEVVGEDGGSAHGKKAEEVTDKITRMHYVETFSTLIDDPPKRAREKQNAELLEKISKEAARKAKAAPKAATPPPSQPASTPQIFPALAPPQPQQQFEFIPGMPGPGPLEQGRAGLAAYKARTLRLLARAEHLLIISPTQEQIDKFKHSEEKWRNEVTLIHNKLIDNGPAEVERGFNELLNSDEYGGRLMVIRNGFGG
jgi:hypothetical protein